MMKYWEQRAVREGNITHVADKQLAQPGSLLRRSPSHAMSSDLIPSS